MISYPKRGALAAKEASAMPLLAGLGVLKYPRTLATSVAPVFVCTSGVWSAEISFAACDSYRIDIDGGAADDVRVSATLEFEES